MAQLDRYTIEELGLAGRVLMATAARECLAELRRRWPDCRRPVILAGPGNNGGDGIALAYYAQAAGLAPTLVLCGERGLQPASAGEDSGLKAALQRDGGTV